MSKRKPVNDEPAAARPPARPASWSATSAGSRSAASASSRARSSAAGPRSSASATPRCRRPNRSASRRGSKSGGALTLLVEGAHAPLIQHLAPMIIERVNRFFGYAAVNKVVFRQGRAPAAAPAAEAARAGAGSEGTWRGPARRRRPRASRLPGVACRAYRGNDRPAGRRCNRRQTHSHQSGA